MSNFSVNSFGINDSNGTEKHIELLNINGELVVKPFMSHDSTEQPSVVTTVEDIELEATGTTGATSVPTDLVDVCFLNSEFESGTYLVDYVFNGNVKGYSVDYVFNENVKGYNSVTGVETAITEWSGFIASKLLRIVTIVNGTSITELGSVSNQGVHSLTQFVQGSVAGFNMVLDNGEVTFSNTIEKNTSASASTVIRLTGKRTLKITKLS